MGLTPRSPEMAGSDTFAMDESSTFMKVASDRASVPRASVPPVSGAGAAVAPEGAADEFNVVHVGGPINPLIGARQG